VKVHGASQSTAYKSEIEMIDQKDRTDDSYVYAARMKLQLEKYWLVPKRQCQWVFLELLKMHLLH
jgi:hypothetical protein